MMKWTCRWSRVAFQLLFFMAVWAAANALAHSWGSKIPGSVRGLGAVLSLLFCGAVPAALVEEGARWFLREMLLFFVPLCVEITGYRDLFVREGVRLFGAVLLGTLVVMAGTAWIVDFVYDWEERRAAARERKENHE